MLDPVAVPKPDDLIDDLERRWRLVEETSLPIDLQPIAFDWLCSLVALAPEGASWAPNAHITLVQLLRSAADLVFECAIPGHLQPAAFRYAARELFRELGGTIAGGSLYEAHGRPTDPPAADDVRPGPGRDDLGAGPI